MTLRNAFEELGTEGMLRKLLRAVTFPRDTSDRQLVAIANQPNISVFAGNNANAGLPSQFISPGANQSWNAHDIREEYREFSHQSFQVARSRWTIS